MTDKTIQHAPEWIERLANDFSKDISHQASFIAGAMQVFNKISELSEHFRKNEVEALIELSTLTKERDGFDSKLEQAYRCGERKATYYKEDGTVILPKNYQGIDG